MYEYKAHVLRVVDGDTVDVDIDLGFGIWLRGERVRIMGIDTPESRTSNKLEKVFGLAAKNRLKELLGKTAILKTMVDKDGGDAKGKFGRILGDFICGDTVVTKILMDEGHCVEYWGQSKDDVQAQHIENRKRLVESGIVTLPKGLTLD